MPTAREQDSRAKPLAGTISRKIPLVSCLIVLAVSCVVQKSTAQQTPGAVVRLRAKVIAGNQTKRLPRKRFFLFKGSLEQNKPLVDAINNQQLTSRHCFYAHAGASPKLIEWLETNDCESIYCREIQPEDVDAVKEFSDALTVGEKSLGNRDLARKWLTVYVPEPLRDGFYRKRQNEIAAIVKQAEASTGAQALSVMTDTKGTAYFTDLDAGNYTLSNIVGTEFGPAIFIWNCDVQVKADDLGSEKPFEISNRKDKNVKCLAIEKPLPVCAP